MDGSLKCIAAENPHDKNLPNVLLTSEMYFITLNCYKTHLILYHINKLYIVRS